METCSGAAGRRAVRLCELHLAQREPKDDWEWYFLMQHFGAPTRLLDWSDVALLALYFAVRQARDSDASVWMLNPKSLNGKMIGLPSIVNWNWGEAQTFLPPDTIFEGIQPKWPAAVDAPHIAARVAVQRSRFTITASTRTDLICLRCTKATAWRSSSLI